MLGTDSEGESKNEEKRSSAGKKRFKPKLKKSKTLLDAEYSKFKKNLIPRGKKATNSVKNKESY
jgi:hypothetical protein